MAYCMPQVCTLLQGESTKASLSLSGGLNNSPLRFAKNPPVILALIYTLPARIYAMVISSKGGVFELSIRYPWLYVVSASIIHNCGHSMPCHDRLCVIDLVASQVCAEKPWLFCVHNVLCAQVPCFLVWLDVDR